MKDHVELEHRQTEMKARFFTDISHEIRTPLTMIVSPIENLIQEKSTPPNIKNQLESVQKNTDKMLNMVNQILDFRKIQQTELNVQQIEIGNFVQSICKDFTATSSHKHIDFKVNNQIGNEKLWLDRIGVEKIIVNLLSNAFKYTPENKVIEVTVYNKSANETAVEVRDEGIGIEKEIQNRLFKRFEAFNTDKSKPSTGIGLSLAKEIADKHSAKIVVDSKLGKGSIFTVIFQKGLTHFGEKVNILNNEKEIAEIKAEKEITETKEIKKINSRKTTILITEDDADLRTFIRSILETDYEVMEATDGEDGYRKATETLPDLIISDIMMPKMDGIEFLHKMRENINTSHILFLLLTAKTTLDNQLEGLRKGADDYITKPFNVSLLLAKIKTIIERQKNLQQYYQNYFQENNNHINSLLPIKPSLAQQDEDFMKIVINIIEKNIDNSDFRIDNIVSEVAMSRTVFYKKIKSLTGLSPVEFIRDLILQRAALLLESGECSVKEASFAIGMSDTKYFSKCFKAKYGINPSEWKDKNR
jgi:DNA-binding response OmpR family regulator/two-component sensor histidine kinase